MNGGYRRVFCADTPEQKFFFLRRKKRPDANSVVAVIDFSTYPHFGSNTVYKRAKADSLYQPLNK